MPEDIIDIHPHVIATDHSRYPLNPLGGTQSGWSRDRPVTTEQLIEAMDLAGVGKAVIVQASTAYAHDNSYVADSVAAHPDRFTGVFSVDVLDPKATSMMQHWLSRGLVGLRLFTVGSTMTKQASWLDDPRSFPAWSFAEEAHIPISVQMSEKGMPQLRRLVEKFPGVRVVLDHLARPSLASGPPYVDAESLFELADYPNVFLKVTVRNFDEAQRGDATPETFFPTLVEKFGADHIAWGSNYPAAEGTLVELLAQARAGLSSLSVKQQNQIFSGTAQELYPTLRSLGLTSE